MENHFDCVLQNWKRQQGVKNERTLSTEEGAASGPVQRGYTAPRRENPETLAPGADRSPACWYSH